MKQLTLYPGAKINIGLYVFEKRPDGFHEIESIFYPVGPDNSNLVPDKLTVSVCENQNEETLFYTENYSEKVRMIECGLDYPGTPQDNICVKAYELLDADFQLPPAMIVLEKHIPVGAGLGGGSSDGVCTLKALNELCGLELSEAQFMDYAARLGSDCPFFVRNEPMLVTGRGEILSALGNQAAKAIAEMEKNYKIEIVFSPECFVSTKMAYSIVPKRLRSQNIPLEEFVTEPLDNWLGKVLNDFEAPVFKEFPQLEKVKQELTKKGAAFVQMTGSGSAIFGLFCKD